MGYFVCLSVCVCVCNITIRVLNIVGLLTALSDRKNPADERRVYNQKQNSEDEGHYRRQVHTNFYI